MVHCRLNSLAGVKTESIPVTAHLDEDAIDTVQEILAEGTVQIDQERTVNDSFATLRARDLDLRAAELDRIIPLASGAKKDELIAPAREVQGLLRPHFRVEYDQTGGHIGRRYRRQDEIGTPFCVTVDFDTLEDQAVTVRDRDTMTQERVGLDSVEAYLSERLGPC